MRTQKETSARSTNYDPVKPTTIRLDDLMVARCEDECQRRGFNSMSELVRQAITFYLSWSGAMRAVRASGGDPAGMDDIELVIRALEAYSENPPRTARDR